MLTLEIMVSDQFYSQGYIMYLYKSLRFCSSGNISASAEKSAMKVVSQVFNGPHRSLTVASPVHLVVPFQLRTIMPDSQHLSLDFHKSRQLLIYNLEMRAITLGRRATPNLGHLV